MKQIFFVALTVLILSACSGSDAPGDRYVGEWTQIGATRGPQLSANIVKKDRDYDIGLSLFAPNGASVKVNKLGTYERGMLKAEGLEAIYIRPGGNLMIGANEFKRIN